MEVRVVKKEEIPQVSQFVEETMKSVFPFPLSEMSKRDLTDMDSLFLAKEKATFIAAFDHDAVVGTIAVRPYDDRIASIKGRYKADDTCEIIKCYVEAKRRQQGIGSLLFAEAERYCAEVGYRIMYLHTHHFLPGGLFFWKKKGFITVLDEGGEMETVHLEKRVPVGE
ncbi:GNAT family N-acetyltransferase [Bacillus alkalicellulosilyticus]|uniref:GNAT family N-acetyltransferase n=1 Tax=Alkalihalobacterium alkalicellulosilyticum TaxID=1912214 RepID=UPI0009966B01|nr:GNAT family N-acetyltransferase [Bacillus alkalicellulosilyticus]